MTGCVVGSDRAQVERRARKVMERMGESGDAGAWMASLADDWIIGTVEEAVDRLGVLQEAGVERVMLQHQAHDDLEMIELVGQEIAPRVAA